MNIDKALAEQYTGKKILIAGGRGYIGSHLASSLTEVDCLVVLLDKSPMVDWMPKSGIAKVQHSEGDLRASSSWHTALIDADIVFHLAGLEYNRVQFSLEDDLQNNVGSIASLLKARDTQKRFPRLVFASSVNLYGAVSDEKITESIRDHPPSIWSAHKLLAENYLQLESKKTNLRSTILRLSNVYGVPARKTKLDHVVVNQLIQRGLITNKIHLYDNLNCERDFLYLDDAVKALLMAGASENIGMQGDLYNVGFGTSLSFSMAWKMIRDKIRSETNEVISIEVNREKKLEPIDFRSFTVSTKKFRSCTGWIPEYDFSRGLEKTVREIVNEG
jgi:UDP-glucose 4-epimerase